MSNFSPKRMFFFFLYEKIFHFSFSLDWTLLHFINKFIFFFANIAIMLFFVGEHFSIEFFLCHSLPKKIWKSVLNKAEIILYLYIVKCDNFSTFILFFFYAYGGQWTLVNLTVFEGWNSFGSTIFSSDFLFKNVQNS